MKKYLFVLVFPCLVSCNDGGDVNDGGSVNEASSSGKVCQSATSIMQEMTQLINDARGQSRLCGEVEFQKTAQIFWNEQLYQAANSHSQDMSSNNFFNHTGSDGLDAGMRIEATGYTAITWGENISAGHTNSRDVVDSWLNSPGHCANIMNPAFTEIGSACAENVSSDYDVYWTLVLAAPK